MLRTKSLKAAAVTACLLGATALAPAFTQHTYYGGGSATSLPTTGNTGNVLTDNGSAWVSSAPSSSLPAAGSSGNVLTSNGSSWTSSALNVSAASGTLPVNHGGTGTTSPSNGLQGVFGGAFYSVSPGSNLIAYCNSSSTWSSSNLWFGTTTMTGTSQSVSCLGMTSSNAVVVTPQSNLGTTTYWVTAGNGSFTINTSASVSSVRFNYIVK